MAGIVIERNVPCTARDGVALATDVFRPDDDRRHPVLLQRTPYDKGFHPFTWAAADPLRMVEAGYAVAIQDVRGRFASGGTYDDLYLHEAADGTDAVEWAATQPWSDGNVGMYGISYMGACQWLAAVSGHRALRALAPVTSPNDLIEDHLRRGGALQLGLLASWTLISMAPAELRRRAAADPSLLPELLGLVDDIDALDQRMGRTPLVPFSPVDARAGGVAPWFSEIARQEVRGPHHDARCISHRHDQVLAPALQIAGWYDALLAGDLSHFVSMRREAGSPEARSLTRLVVGPWSHATFTSSVGELDFGVRAAGISLDLREDLTGLHRRWFDQRLRGIDTGIDDEPAVRLFVMGRNRWQGFDDWPPPGRRPEPWYLHPGGGLSPAVPAEGEPSSAFRLDPERPVPTRGGNLLMAGKYIRGPIEQALTERHPDVLLFTSAPLQHELEVIGPVRLVAWVAASTLDSDVVARLCDVHPDGRSYNIVDGILRLRFRHSLRTPTPMPLGQPERVEVDLWSTAHVFAAGHRLRLHICASDFPRYDRCAGTGDPAATATQIVAQHNNLLHSPERSSHLVLPVPA
jgi:putative CocE/NonD family hydrolase